MVRCLRRKCVHSFGEVGLVVPYWSSECSYLVVLHYSSCISVPDQWCEKRLHSPGAGGLRANSLGIVGAWDNPCSPLLALVRHLFAGQPTAIIPVPRG